MVVPRLNLNRFSPGPHSKPSVSPSQSVRRHLQKISLRYCLSPRVVYPKWIRRWVNTEENLIGCQGTSESEKVEEVRNPFHSKDIISGIRVLWVLPRRGDLLDITMWISISLCIVFHQLSHPRPKVTGPPLLILSLRWTVWTVCQWWVICNILCIIHYRRKNPGVTDPVTKRERERLSQSEQSPTKLNPSFLEGWGRRVHRP